MNLSLFFHYSRSFCKHLNIVDTSDAALSGFYPREKIYVYRANLRSINADFSRFIDIPNAV